MAQMTAFSKLLVVGVVLGGAFFGYRYATNHGLIPQGKQVQDIKPGAFDSSSNSSAPVQEASASSEAAPAQASYSSNGGALGRPIRISVVTWGGYSGGEWANQGFKPNAESYFKKKYGLDVEFVLQDDYQTSRDAWKAGKVDLLWTTADSFVTESEAMAAYNPKIVFQADWSRGGDAIVATRDIHSVADLKGKRVSVAFGTPSNTFLLWLLSAGGLAWSDINVVQAPSAIDSATFFKTGKVDAAVVWSPDDTDCVATVTGSHVLSNTKSASNIIADVFYAKQDFIEAHPTEIKELVDGWLWGAAQLNGSDAKRHQAAAILAAGEGQPEPACYSSILNTRLCTYGDNVNFFNINGGYPGVKGEELYSKMETLYSKLNQCTDKAPAWRTVSDTSVLRSITDLNGPGDAAEGKARFTPISDTQAENLGSVATKRATVEFASGSSTLDSSAQDIIDSNFADISRTFSHSRILITGNTDSTGSAALNQRLSKLRAQAVASYLVKTYGFDRNRFTIEGHGASNPVASNDDDAGRAANRRTDFELLNAQ